MARKQYIKWEKFQGVNLGLDKTEGNDFLEGLENFDSNVVDGQLVSRKGYVSCVNTGTEHLDKIFVYRDEEWGKDVLLAYQKNSAVADRRIRLYTKDLGASGHFVYQDSFSYGGIELGDKINFLLDRNGVRIGTGTGKNNKALYAGYIDRSVASGRAMFGNKISFSGFYVKKQQWVRTADIFSGVTSFRYDNDQERWYLLTNRGLEIRNSNFRIERILEDVMSWGGWNEGSVSFKNNDLYVLGKQKASGSTTKLYRYDISNDYRVHDSKVYSTSNHRAKHVCCDGTNVFVMIEEAGTYVVRKYSMNLIGAGKIIYTASRGDLFSCMTCDDTANTGYLYVADVLNKKLHRFKKDGTTLYGSNVVINPIKTALPDDMDFYNARVYWVNFGTVYSISADFTGSITTEKSDSFTLRSNDQRISINQATGKAYSYNSDGFIRVFSSAINWIPESTHGALISLHTDQSIDGSTFFYGISIVDIFGQEHMLQSAMAAHVGNAFTQIAIIINPWIELYNEQGLPDVASSHNPTNVKSTWNELRLIKKIRVYRAESSEVNAAWPTTNYNFLREIDINDSIYWKENTAHKQYSYFFYDSIGRGKASSVTYRENSGLPERIFPYYTNWQYAKVFKNRFYYGNVRTDDLYRQQIIQTPVNSPDVVYQLSTNIDMFGPDDGDGIKGFSETWQRLVVFKGNKTAIYNELFREKVYDCGLQAGNYPVAKGTEFAVFITSINLM